MGLLLLMSKRDTGLVLPGSVATWDMVTMVNSQTVKDISGKGNHLQLGSTSGVDANDPLNVGNGFTFDGVDDYLLGPSLALPVPFTWLAVFNATAAGAIIGPGALGGFLLSVSSATGALSAGSRGVADIGSSTSTDYRLGGWHLVGFSYDGSSYQFWRDGQVDGTGTNAVSITSPMVCWVGNDYFSNPLTGTVALVEAVPRILTAGEHAAHYAGVKASLATRTPAIVLP